MTAWEGNVWYCHPKKTNVDWGSQYYLIKYIVYIKTIQVKWIFEFVIHTRSCKFKRSCDASQNLRWTIGTKILRSRYFLKIACMKQYRMLPSSITCKGMVSWFSRWYYINIDCTRGLHGKLSPGENQCQTNWGQHAFFQIWELTQFVLIRLKEKSLVN